MQERYFVNGIQGQLSFITKKHLRITDGTIPWLTFLFNWGQNIMV